MAYPKQLISSLADNLNEALVNFFEIEHLKIFSAYSSLNDLIADTLWEYVKEETGKSELKSIFGTQVKMRRQKKNRWLKTLEENIHNYAMTNKKHPFYSIQHNYEILPGHSFLKLYDAKDLDSAVKKYTAAINEWAENDKSLLIEYPLISDKTRKQILSSFQIDLIINLIDSIIVYWDGNIEAYFAKKPEIFIFDDSFSALDLKTDRNLREALKEKTEGKTVIIVAQRVSTILNAEQIIVLEEGKIVGIGTHDELLESCETYKQIATSQLSEEELKRKEM